MEIAQLNDVTELFRRIREENKLSQTQLAERINANGSYLSTLESGKNVPGKHILKKLAKEFSLDLDQCLALVKPANKTEETNDRQKGKSSEKNKVNIINLEERKNRAKEKGEINLDKIKTTATLFSTVRKANNFTISKMVEKMGSSPSYISQIENGKKAPGRRMITKLAEKFDLPIERCLEIAGFSKKKVEINKPLHKENKTIVEPDKETKNNEIKVMVEVNSAIESKLENELDEVSTAIVDENEIHNFAPVDTIDEKEEDSKTGDIIVIKEPVEEEATVEKMNYKIIARGEFDLTNGRKYVTELMPIVENMKENSYSYEFLLNIGGEHKKSIVLSIENNEMTVELIN